MLDTLRVQNSRGDGLRHAKWTNDQRDWRGLQPSSKFITGTALTPAQKVPRLLETVSPRRTSTVPRPVACTTQLRPHNQNGDPTTEHHITVILPAERTTCSYICFTCFFNGRISTLLFPFPRGRFKWVLIHSKNLRTVCLVLFEPRIRYT